MAKRLGSNTAHSQARLFELAQAAPIAPPERCNVPAAAMPFWKSIIDCRPMDTWNDHDLEIAADLAKDKLLAKELRDELDANNSYIDSKGKASAKAKLLDVTLRRINQTSRILLVNTAAVSGGSQENRKRKEAEAKAKQSASKLELYGGLIASRH